LDKFPDGISCLQYLPSSSATGGDGTSTKLASTNWDGAVRVHDTANSSSSPMVLSHNMESGPLLSLAIPSTTNALVTGGLDGSIKLLDIETTTIQTIGKHTSNNKEGSNDETSSGVNPSNACSCLAAMNGDNPHVIVSASWNRQLCLWDLRQNDRQQGQQPIAQINLPGKAFAMDVDSSHGTILVATSGRHNCFYDLRKTATSLVLHPVLERESSLKFQTRCVKMFPDGHGFCIGSIEGRVGVEFMEELNLPANGMKKYAFKCHRVQDTVYPVNCITFHPKYTTTFATGGCDGTVVLWDCANKKKLTALPTFPTSISALAFSPDGTELAIASSYTHEEGDREHPQDEIYVRKILESEAMPKNK
jgi:cell cycle arrest protein BUB3